MQGCNSLRATKERSGYRWYQPTVLQGITSITSWEMWTSMNHHELPNIWLSALTISSIVKRTAPGHFFFQKCSSAAVTGDLAFARAPRLDKGGGFFFGCQSCWIWLASRPMCCNGQSLHLCPGIQQLCPSNGGKGIGHSRHSKASIGMVCIKWALLPAKCPGITQDLSTPRVWKYLVHWCDRIF